MSGCAAIEGKLSAFFDGELEGDAADEVVAHLDVCERCRARLEGFDEVDAPLRAIEPPAVAAGEWNRCWGVIEAAIATEARPEPAAAPRGGEAPLARPASAPPPLVPRLVVRPPVPVPVSDANLPVPAPQLDEVAAHAAGRLVRFLIPLAAAAAFILAAYGAQILTAHEGASRAIGDDVAVVGLAPAGDNP